MSTLNFGANATDKVQMGTHTPWPAAWTFWLWVYLLNSTVRQRWFQNAGADAEFMDFRGDNTPDGFLCSLSRNVGANYCSVSGDMTNFAAYGAGANKWFCFVVIGDTNSASDADQRILLGDINSPPKEPSAYTAQTRGSGAIDAGTTFKYGNNNVDNIVSVARFWRSGLIPRALNQADVGTLYRETRHQLLDARRHGQEFLYQFGTNGRGIVCDESGKNLHGTITGAVPNNDSTPGNGFQGWRPLRAKYLPFPVAPKYAATLLDGVLQGSR